MYIIYVYKNSSYLGLVVQGVGQEVLYVVVVAQLARHHQGRVSVGVLHVGVEQGRLPLVPLCDPERVLVEEHTQGVAQFMDNVDARHRSRANQGAPPPGDVDVQKRERIIAEMDVRGRVAGSLHTSE